MDLPQRAGQSWGVSPSLILANKQEFVKDTRERALKKPPSAGAAPGDYKSLLTLIVGVGHTNPKGLGRIKPVMTGVINVAPTNPLGQENKS